MNSQPSTDLVDTLLSVIPSLPRTVLDRLVTDMIDRMDEMDGDPDMEDDEREPEWYFHGRSSFQLPGARSHGGSRIGRLRCGHMGPRHRHRTVGHHWRKRVRH